MLSRNQGAIRCCDRLRAACSRKHTALKPSGGELAPRIGCDATANRKARRGGWTSRCPSFGASNPAEGALRAKTNGRQRCEKVRMCTHGTRQTLLGYVNAKVMDGAFGRHSAFVMCWKAETCSRMQFTRDDNRWRSHVVYACASCIISPSVHNAAKIASARLAQPAERKALNLVVVGSSPTVGALQNYLNGREKQKNKKKEIRIRRRGGIEPLHVSMPHELRSCPSTSPTHLGNKETLRGGSADANHNRRRRLFPWLAVLWNLICSAFADMMNLGA